MAKRKYPMAKTKIQPMPLKINFLMTPDTQTAYIDIFREVSRLSRKFIRQGHIAAIGNIRVTMPPATTPSVGSALYISAMQNTWSVSNAWEKSFAMWNRQQKEAIDESGAESAVARFRDFKVFLDAGHWQANNPAGTATQKQLSAVNLGPFETIGPFPSSAIATAAVAAGEWEYSQIVIPNVGGTGVSEEYFLTMHGNHEAALGTYPGAKAMVKGYQNSRATPQSPDPVTPGLVKANWMAEMFDVGETFDDVLDNATVRNNDLPYDQDEYPGGSVNYINPENKAWLLNRSTTGLTQFNLGGMVAPCGLLRIDCINVVDGSDPILIEVELLPGPARGLLAAKMGDM